MNSKNIEYYGLENPNEFQKLRHSGIIGIIDSYDNVESTIYPLSKNNIPTHSDLYPSNTFKRWRWSFSNELESFINISDFNIEDWDRVRNHIESRYGIKFWENGYHNIDYFIEQMKR